MWQEQKTPREIVTKARNAFTSGVTKDINYRLKSLNGFKKFLQEHKELIVEKMFEDQRKHKEEGRLEVIVAIAHVNYLIHHFKNWVSPEKRPRRLMDLLDGVYVHNDPYGVVLVMSTWNAPILTLVPIAGAIAAGNCVVIKPSHNSPKLGQMLASVLPEYLDPSCYPVFLGDIDDTNKLLEQRFDYIYYTGSVKVGKIVHLAANKHLTPVTLELGGQNPVYIDPSADLELAATRIMWGKCFLSGHGCLAPNYILCTKAVEEEFIKHAKNALTKFYNNDPKCCPIANVQQFKRLQTLLTGLNVAIGGRCDELDNYIEPTVVTDVKPDDLVMQEEIFGPILPVLTINDVKEAVDFINQKEKPLAFYIFTEDSSVKDYIIKNTSSGGVTVNDTLMHMTVESLPFGGVGLSGMGRYKGKDSVDTFVHKKSVLVKNSSRMMERMNFLRYPPYSRRHTDILEFLLQFRRPPPSLGWFLYVIIFLLGFAVGFSVLLYYNKYYNLIQVSTKL